MMEDAEVAFSYHNNNSSSPGRLTAGVCTRSLGKKCLWRCVGVCCGASVGLCDVSGKLCGVRGV